MEDSGWQISPASANKSQGDTWFSFVRSSLRSLYQVRCLLALKGAFLPLWPPTLEPASTTTTLAIRAISNLALEARVSAMLGLHAPCKQPGQMLFILLAIDFVICRRMLSWWCRIASASLATELPSVPVNSIPISL